MIEPMLCKLTGPEVQLTGTWISEPKYDGERIIASRKGDKISLWTRRHIQVSKKFPEITQALTKNMNDDNWIVDGEITVHGGFRDLLKRNVENKFKIHILSKKIPATYNIFDIIQWKGEDLISKPLIERKKVLIDAVYMDDRMRIVPFLKVDNQTVRKHFLEYLKDGFEGAVIKNAFSKYEPGKRSGQWIKIKREDTVDVYVVGATKSTGSIPFGALILKKDGRYFGKVGTGFTDQQRKDILKILEKNRGPRGIMLPPEIESEVLLTSKPLLAEIKIQEIIKGSPRSPVWVRFRWE
ncbi:ATP-dependent DNA ligase [Methanobacterium paludis]|uniref:ATP dependent DNA ligase n=1 Tax=Methanobacterium paludis (strain DSM 25820 / JCM 18151 / SWAN1) TaxID=868131 RepID=F6D5P5_METPW|nr:ATP-dependent DNA ligase [Methanobacterium paludis]AEG18227.1 ATP dependent DNA ligase [Methanobacterium paludis]